MAEKPRYTYLLIYSKDNYDNSRRSYRYGNDNYRIVLNPFKMKISEFNAITLKLAMGELTSNYKEQKEDNRRISNTFEDLVNIIKNQKMYKLYKVDLYEHFNKDDIISGVLNHLITNNKKISEYELKDFV